MGAMRSRTFIVKGSFALCLETCTVTGAVLSFEHSSSLSAVLALFLATCLCDSRLAARMVRLLEPVWHRMSGYQAAVPLDFACPAPTSTHRLCTLPQNKRDAYSTPNVRVSRTRAPPSSSAPRQ